MTALRKMAWWRFGNRKPDTIAGTYWVCPGDMLFMKSFHGTGRSCLHHKLWQGYSSLDESMLGVLTQIATASLPHIRRITRRLTQEEKPFLSLPYLSQKVTIENTNKFSWKNIPPKFDLIDFIDGLSEQWNTVFFVRLFLGIKAWISASTSSIV